VGQVSFPSVENTGERFSNVSLGFEVRVSLGSKKDKIAINLMILLAFIHEFTIVVWMS
jgi:hypothetical protein